MDKIINLVPFWEKSSYYTQVLLSYPYKDTSPHLFNKIIPALEKLDSNPSNVRMVFWFDN